MSEIATKIQKVLDVSFKVINEKLNEILKEEGIYRNEDEIAAVEISPSSVEAEAEEEGSPPAPKATKLVTEEKGKINKSDLIREFFNKNPASKNKDAIDYINKNYKIKLHPALVSSVKKKFQESPTEKKETSAKKSETKKSEAKKSVTKKSNKLSMTACVTKVMARSKKGMNADQVIEKVEDLYTYTGNKGKEGLKSIVYQALYNLSLEKSRRGWKDSSPILLHDEGSHTWKLNPEAKKIA